MSSIKTFSNTPTTILFQIFIGKRLEVFKSKAVIFKDRQEKADVKLRELNPAENSNLTNECTIPLIEGVYRHWIEALQKKNVKKFNETCYRVCTLNIDYKPFRKTLSRQVNMAINEVI